MKLRVLVESVLIPHSAFEEASRRARQCIEYVREGGQEPVCLALVGESRTGKSRCIEGIMREYPMARTASGIVAPVVAIRVPPKPTVKSLVEQFLVKLGDPGWHKGTEMDKTARFIRLARECEVDALALDEFHHFYDKASHKVQHHVADWMKNIVSDTNVALIAIGLRSLQSVIDQNEQLAGRFSAPVEMPRFNWSDPELREEWVGILAGFDEILGVHFDLPALSDELMAFRVYCATGGLIGYLTNILRQAVWNAIDSSKHSIGLSELEAAYRQAIYALEERKISRNELTPFSWDWNSTPNEAANRAAERVGIPVSEQAKPPASHASRTRVSASSVLVA